MSVLICQSEIEIEIRKKTFYQILERIVLNFSKYIDFLQNEESSKISSEINKLYNLNIIQVIQSLHINENSQLFVLNSSKAPSTEILIFYMLRIKSFLNSILETKELDCNTSIKSDDVFISYRNEDANLNFRRKINFIEFFETLTQQDFRKDKIILSFLKDFWIILKDHNCLLSAYLNFNSIAESLEELTVLRMFGIGKKHNYPEDFELHIAVLNNNLREIRRYCANETNEHIYCDINEIDLQGDSPLKLAVKHQYYDAIKVLIDHDADINHIPFEGSLSPLDLALSIKNENLVRILLTSNRNEIFNQWENNKLEISKILKTIPDFELDFKLQVSSKIFFFSSILPCEKFKIIKKGNKVRIDMKINNKYPKGLYSILIKEKNGTMSIFELDHVKKKLV